jgi:hypothetical protein
MAIALLERDVKILEFIAKFGFCQDRHIIQLCDLTPKYYLKVIKRLVDEDYVERNRILAYEEAYLMLSKNGGRFLGLTTTAKPVLNTLNHDTLLIDLYFKLETYYTNANFKTDKELRRDYAIHEANETKRIPDILIDDSIAIELELSEKPLNKLTAIINSYILSNDISEVHYYVMSKRIYSKLRSLTLNYPKFKFFMLTVVDKQITAINPLNPLNEEAANSGNHLGQPKKFGAYVYEP